MAKETTCRAAEDFQKESEEIGERFGAAPGQTDIQERGNYANQNPCKTKRESTLRPTQNANKKQATKDAGGAT
jgi:hypothetical protein